MPPNAIDDSWPQQFFTDKKKLLDKISSPTSKMAVQDGIAILDLAAVLDFARFHDIKEAHVRALWRAVVKDGVAELGTASGYGVPASVRGVD